jgi:hypothetical protein
MWVLNSLVFVVPAVGITLQLLMPRSLRGTNFVSNTRRPGAPA